MSAKFKVLVAEDNPDDVLLLQRALAKSSFGLPVRCVSDGQEVLDYLEGHPPFSDRLRYPLPTLLLLDLKMPRVDGFEVLTWLRQHPSLGRMLVVVLTGSPMKEDVK